MNIEYTSSIWSLNENEAIKDLENLKLGEECFYPESDYGHGFVVRTSKGFECYSIPMYGGESQLETTTETAEEAFNEVVSWT